MLRIHDPGFSDIDLIDLWSGSGQPVADGSHRESYPGISPLDEAFLGGWRREIAEHHDLTDEEVRWLVARRWNFMYYGQGRYLSLHPVRSDAEIREVYGEHSYRDAGVVRLRAIISDAADSIFLPAIYDIEQVQGSGRASMWKLMKSARTRVSLARPRMLDKRSRRRASWNAGRWPRARLVIGSSHRTGLEYLKPAHL